MEFVPTPFRKRDGAGLPLVTPVKRANTAAARPVNVSPQDFDKGSVARSLQGYSLVAIGALSTAQIAEVLKTAARMRELVEKQGGDESLKGRVLASVFYEPSTRTSCSFQAAMLRLGGAVLAVNESSSSVAKGESLEDTVRSVECYADVVVLRHPRAGAAAEAAAAMAKPLLNAGDGVGEHPSQALLDLGGEGGPIHDPGRGARRQRQRGGKVRGGPGCGAAGQGRHDGGRPQEWADSALAG
ncbi:unnamed protein product [Prorocentrum cordatum]|uniref:Aspartate/ornithine carbamoyltransferase carbamoyl-P binding domain-containing protein n=1 Tax=Prorocentrum cordatum TaxID=2364126 RepID=A0ABN9TKX0_9DINO|nr:unnamed protein product [Polarella glacialis]